MQTAYKCQACEGESRYHTCCSRCNDQENGEARYSLGIYAGRYCDKCWEESGYRKEGRDGYDYLDAGEHYDADY